MIQAIVFDMDGVLVDSEQLWDQTRRGVVAELGGRWKPGATEAMQGMSSPEWSAYLHDDLGVDMAPGAIVEVVLERMLTRYQERLPLIPGAREAVRRLGERWPLAVASSANRPLIDAVMAAGALADYFQATVSSEEVARGKPAPDVYLEAVHRLGADPRCCAAIEDSGNGILSAQAAGLAVVAVPNAGFPPPASVLETADLVIDDLAGLTVAAIERLGPGR